MVIACFLAQATFNNQGEKGIIHIQITGIEDKKGQVLIHIFNQSKGFPTNPQFAFKEYRIPVENLPVSLTLLDLPVGEYAIAVFHDENMDGQLNTNLLKIPKEKVGVSNNPNALFIPSYKDAKFNLSSSEVIQKINLK